MTGTDSQHCDVGRIVRKKELTVKEYANRERVTERTVWEWKKKGAVDFRKTPGGGVRIFVIELD